MEYTFGDNFSFFSPRLALLTNLMGPIIIPNIHARVQNYYVNDDE